MRAEQKIFIDLLKKTGLTQHGFAKKVGWAQSRVSRCGSGKIHLNFTELQELANAFGFQIKRKFEMVRREKGWWVCADNDKKEKDLSHYRKEYERGECSAEKTLQNPVAQFQKWFEEAEDETSDEVNAMALSTLGEDGYPKTRMVLLKAVTESGFVFFTNYNSDKGRDIQEHPKVCLSFFWSHMERQVIIKGRCQKTAAATSDAYFEKRPRGSQLGAWASDQSKAIRNRDALEEKYRMFEEQFRGHAVPRPPHWGGYVVQPQGIEFWQGGTDRLHDRIRYTLKAGAWQKTRLSP